MRRLLSIAAAGVLALALAAPAMAGANTSNTSGSAQIVNGEWYSETGSGYAYFANDSSYGPSGEFYEESGEWIACDDTGESYGFVGTRTYGKGSVQEPSTLSDGSALELTVGRYLTPSGRSLDGVGIEPDVVVPPGAAPEVAERRAIDVLTGLVAALGGTGRG